MKSWKKWLVPALFVLASVSFLIPGVVKPVIKDEPLNHTFLVFALACAVFAMIFFAVARKADAGPRPPSV
jgi:hypothetical protein